MKPITIENLNGVARLEVAITGPGVWVARGPNGAGKSSTIEAMRALYGDEKARVEPSDGQAKGSASADGVTLRVGNRKTREGWPTVRLLNTGALGQLIDPGIKDSETAARARIKALLQLMPLPADEAARLALTGNDQELQQWIKGDPSVDAADLAEAVRRRANELANECEKESAAADGEVLSLQGLINQLGPLDFEAGDYKTARQEADRMLREAERMVYQANARAELEYKQRQIAKTLGPRPDEKQPGMEVERLSEEIGKLDRQLAVLKEQLHHARIERSKLTELVQAWDAQSEILRRPLEGPTKEAAEEFSKLAGKAAGKAIRAEVLGRAMDYQAKANAAKERATAKSERGEQLRTIARSTAGALGELLERRGLPGLTIQSGRLAVKADKETFKDFERRLSFGERVRKALEIALLAQKNGETGLMAILPLDPAFWLALDAQRKTEICSIAKEMGVCLVTEEPSEGPLRVEEMKA